MPGSVLAGLVLDSTVTGGTAKTQIVDGAGDVAAITAAGALSTQIVSGANVMAVSAGGAASVAIVGTPTVSISGTPSVTVSGTPTVSISGTPAVTVSGVALDATLTGGTARTQLVSSGGNAAAVNAAGALSTQAVDLTASISIAANATSSGSVTGLNGAATATIQLTGTFSATAQVQVTADGSTWLNVTGSNSIINAQTGAYMASGNLTATGLYQLDVAGVSGVRVITTAYTSGTITGTVRVTNTPAAVSIEGTPAVTVSSGTITTVSTVTTCSTVTTVNSVTAANLNIPGSITDIASAVINTLGLTNSSTITPTFGSSYSVVVAVSAASGTGQVMDIVVQESMDGGSTWYDVYHFPRISGTGTFISPQLPLTGNRVRYAQTLGGTTPSFTRAINRLQASTSVSVYRQLIDRTVSLTTLNAATSALTVQGCSGVQLVINLGAATTAPTLVIEGSDDGGASWYTLGTLLGVASSTVQISVPGVSPQQIRARVSVVGATVTAGYVLIRGY